MSDIKKKTLSIGGKATGKKVSLSIGGKLTTNSRSVRKKVVLNPSLRLKTKFSRNNDTAGGDNSKYKNVLTESQKKAIANAHKLKENIHSNAMEASRISKERQKYTEEQRKRQENYENIIRKRNEPKIEIKPEKKVFEKEKSQKQFSQVKTKTNAYAEMPKKQSSKKGEAGRRQSKKLTISQALSGDDVGVRRTMSDAAFKRRREKEKLKAQLSLEPKEKIIKDVIIPENITVSDLANRMAERQADIVKCLMKMGLMVTPQQLIDADTAEIVVGEFGHNFKRVAESDLEDEIMKDDEDLSENLEDRPPVVTVMGHVDHGKTTLLDAFRKTSVASVEAGGITQHISSYSVELKDGKKITFLDTPGHESFIDMRKRGANLTDIAIIVIAADDGVLPQTAESIRNAKEANVSIIIAVNKIDKPNIDVKKIKTQLLEHNVQVEEFGGEVQCIEISAKENKNLDKLEEAILLQSEMLELKANPNKLARGVVIETQMVKGRGIVATVLVQKGTLSVGQIFFAGAAYGKVRGIKDHNGKTLVKAGPSQPVEVQGWNGTPFSGDEFVVVSSEIKAKEITEYRKRKLKDEAKIVKASGSSMDDIFSKIKKGAIKEVPIIVKADTIGSYQAIKTAIEKLTADNSEINAKVISGGVGGVIETDVTRAISSEAFILGFNVRANSYADSLAMQNGIDIRYYSVIYSLLDDVKDLIGGMLVPEIKEKIIGHAEIRQVFKITGSGKIAGCYVTDGIVKRGAYIRLIREDIVIHECSLKQLKREKDDAKEVSSNYECGIQLEKYQDIKVSDVIECFEKEEIKRTL